MADNRLQYIFDLVKGKNEIGPALTKAQKGASKTAEKVKSLGKSFGGLAGKVGIVGGLIGGLAGAFAIKKFVAAANQQEDAINKLNIALKSTGIFSKETSEDFQAYASSLQQASRFGDELILENAALIQSLGDLSGQALKDATKASLDLSAALGIDLTSASTLVGKAAAGNVSSFSRYGVVIKKGSDNAETFANTLEALGKKFGGAAKGQLETFAGSTDQLSNSFGDLLEELGFLITKNPIVVSVVKGLNKAITASISVVNKNRDAFIDLVNRGVVGAVNGFTTLIGIFPKIITGVDNAIRGFKILKETIKIIASAINAALVGAFTSPFIILEEGINSLGEKIPLIGDKIGKVNFGFADAMASQVEGVKEGVDNIDKILTEKTFLSDLANTTEQIGKPFGDQLKKIVQESVQGGGAAGIESIPVPDEPILIPFRLDEESIQGSIKDPFKALFGNKKLDLSSSIGIGTGLVQSIAEGAKGAKKVLVQAGAALGDVLLPGVGAAVGPLLDVFSQGPEAVKAFVGDFVKAIPDLLEAIVEGAPAFIEEIINQLPGLINSLVDKLPLLIRGLVRQIPTLIRSLVDSMPEVMQGLATAVPILITELIAAIPLVAIALATSFVEFFASGKVYEIGFAIAKSIVEALIGQVKRLGEVGGKIVEPIKNFFKNIDLSSLTDGFKKLGGKIFEGFKKLFNIFNPANVLKKIFKFDGGGKGAVEKLIGVDFPFIKFAKGGIVPGKAKFPGNDLRNDTVPALLSPGEYVIPRSDMKNFAFGGSVGGFLGDLVGGVTSFTSNLISDIANATGLPSAIASLTLSLVPDKLREILQFLLNTFGNLDIPRFVSEPIDYTKEIVGKNVDFFKPQFKKLVGLQTGGTIPGGFPNDSFMAGLSSGENVVDRSTNMRLEKFLDKSENNSDMATTNVLLAKIVGLLATGQTVDARVELNKREFANIILELNRTNARLTA